MNALLAAIVAGSLVVTTTVDVLKHLLAKVRLPQGTWTLSGFVVGVAYCIGWQLDLSAQAMQLIPTLQTHRLTGVAGQVLTGLVLGTFSRYSHEILDALANHNTNTEYARMKLGTDIAISQQSRQMEAAKRARKHKK